MPNGTKSPMIASAAADISSSSGIRTHSAELPEPGGPGSSSGARPLASLASSRLLIVPSWRFIIGRGGQSCGRGTSGAHRPLPLERHRAVAERAEHGEDLVSPTRAMHAHLARSGGRARPRRRRARAPRRSRVARGTARSPRCTAGRSPAPSPRCTRRDRSRRTARRCPRSARARPASASAAVRRVGFEPKKVRVHRPSTLPVGPGRAPTWPCLDVRRSPCRGALRSTRPACSVSFMPVSVRSACRIRHASMRCA